jgi:tetraacyldisaccharide 4'-kinase
MSSVLRYLLFPLAVLYDGATRLRNHLYDIGHYHSLRFDVPVISVGNLNAGGAGKTPLAEYIIRLLSKELRCAFLSRGYGRRTRGLRLASAGDNPSTLGDEPYQVWKKFGTGVPVAVCEDRAYAIPHLVHKHDAQVVILDDAFQHRTVDPALSILVTEFRKPFFKDFILPAGQLREARSGARRADMVVVSKCPDSLTAKERGDYTENIQRYTGSKPVYFASFIYRDIVWNETPGGNVVHSVVLVTGIANPGPLLEFLKPRFNIVRHYRFRDHHPYKSSDIERILRYGAGLKGLFVLLTTEKDWSKIGEFRERLAGVPVGVIPVEYDFLADGADFDNRVRDAANRPV